MARTSMNDLHTHLFDIIERLKDPDEATPMDKETAMTIVKVAETVIQAGRAEVEYLRAVSDMPMSMGLSEPTKPTLFLKS